MAINVGRVHLIWVAEAVFTGNCASNKSDNGRYLIKVIVKLIHLLTISSSYSSLLLSALESGFALVKCVSLFSLSILAKPCLQSTAK